MLAADHHSIAKHAAKEIGWQQGNAVSFLPKWHHDKVGSAAHIHQSLWKNGKPVFFDKDDALGMSAVMKQYLAGLLAHSAATTYFLAPYINSYKRFAKGTFAPTRIIWSVDNRTAGYRVCGEGTSGVRVECRIGGSDLNPYLAMAAQLAAGLSGIEAGMEPPDPARGDVFEVCGEESGVPEPGDRIRRRYAGSG